MSDLNRFMDMIGYYFQDEALLRRAMTHSSFAHEMHKPYHENNERLEFLGDAVLELVSSDYIFSHYPTMVEGDMTTLRASLVCEQSLAGAARELDLSDYILLSHGEIKTGGGARDSILSDAFEAIIGALYIDGGYDVAKEFITKYVLTDIEHKQLYHDSKSKLQEAVQDRYHADSSIVYEVISETGPAHKKHFKVKCILQGKDISTGEGQTKKKAEQDAAYNALLKVRKEGI